MANLIRVLMADDSAAVRRLVSDTLSKDPEIQVVGAARHGKEALSMIPTARPDVILLDVEMPVMDGLDTLRQIRRNDRHTPVLMFSSLTVKGGEATLEALSLGASDYVSKPVAAGHIDEAIRYLNTELVPKLKQWGNRAAARHTVAIQTTPKSNAVNAAKKASARGVSTKRNTPGPIDVIAIGSSTGGPNALAEVVRDLPHDLGVPILIVQHMPPLFTKLLAERLDRSSPLTVREAFDGAAIRPGEIWIAPGDHHMVVKDVAGQKQISVNQAPPENSCRPSVDVMFRSVCDAYGGRSLAVVLTGMGKDGMQGTGQMREKGTFVIAQNEASSVVWGMPRAVVEAGYADRELPLEDIAKEITRHARGGRSAPALAASR